MIVVEHNRVKSFLMSHFNLSLKDNSNNIGIKATRLKAESVDHNKVIFFLKSHLIWFHITEYMGTVKIMWLLTGDGYVCSWQPFFFSDLALWFQGKRKGQSIGNWERKPNSGPICFVFSLYCIYGVFLSSWVDKKPRKHIKQIESAVHEGKKECDTVWIQLIWKCIDLKFMEE